MKKKLGGILVETSILEGKVNYFLFGVGINLVSNPKNLMLSNNFSNKFVKKNKSIKIIFRNF